MSNFEEDGIDVESLKEDDSVEWWRATKKDNFDLTTKLLRTGCRPIKRQYLECIRGETFDEFKNCQVND